MISDLRPRVANDENSANENNYSPVRVSWESEPRKKEDKIEVTAIIVELSFFEEEEEEAKTKRKSLEMIVIAALKCCCWWVADGAALGGGSKPSRPKKQVVECCQVLFVVLNWGVCKWVFVCSFCLHPPLHKTDRRTLFWWGEKSVSV